MSPPVTDGRAQKALHRPQGRADLRQTQRRRVGGEVGDPERFGKAAQVGEELRSPRQVHEFLVVFGGHPGGDEGLQNAVLVEGGKAADPRAREGASCVHHLLQDGVEVEVLGDADARLSQSGEAVPQGFNLPFQAVCWLQCATSLVLRKTPYSHPH